jgi:hypothetical protein
MVDFPISCTQDEAMNEKEFISMGQWSVETLETLMKEAGSIDDPGERIGFLSRRSLGTFYEESTLIGDQKREEVLVVNLEAVDCFTFIDYVEAMRLSSSFPEFRESLKKIRYRGGVVSFENRKHFFTDWVEFNRDHVEDITDAVGFRNTRMVPKALNLKKDGTCFLPGIGPVHREIRYIPSSSLDNQVVGRLKTGDYIGIYSELDGLDVSHVGIFIRVGRSLFLRHASSKKEIRQVVDEDFMEYVKKKLGIIILRPQK